VRFWRSCGILIHPRVRTSLSEVTIVFMKKNLRATARGKGPVPEGMHILLARLFGSESTEARREKRNAAEWRKTLKAVLDELDRYIAANVDSDELHRLMLMSGLAAANESLDHEDFWPGYAAGLTRLALLLLGDYPDHRKRKPGRKRDGHYKLNTCRSGQWLQTPGQRYRTLLAAGQVGFPKLSAPPRDLADEFFLQRRRIDHSGFMEYYRERFPRDYATLFR
jgi:hypothetical protein